MTICVDYFERAHMCAMDPKELIVGDGETPTYCSSDSLDTPTIESGE